MQGNIIKVLLTDKQSYNKKILRGCLIFIDVSISFATTVLFLFKSAAEAKPNCFKETNKIIVLEFCSHFVNSINENKNHFLFFK